MVCTDILLSVWLELLINSQGDVLFNDSLNTFDLWLYGVGDMVKNHWDSERESPATFSNLPHEIFYMHHPTYRTAHTTAFGIPVVEQWLEWEWVQWVHHEWSSRRPTEDCNFIFGVFYSDLLQCFECKQLKIPLTLYTILSRSSSFERRET